MTRQGSVRRRTFLRVSTVVLVLAAMFAFAGQASAAGLQLRFVQQPSDSLAGQPIAPAVTVAVLDENGQLRSTSTARVTISLLGGGTLFGTRTTNAVNGIATFADLIVVPAGTYTLAATAGSKIAGTESEPFDVSGSAVDCKSSECTASTGDLKNLTAENKTVGFARVPTDRCTTQTCFLTVDEDQECPPGLTCRGNAFLFIPPGNARGAITAKLGCDVTACPEGEPVSIYKQRTDGTWVQLFDCPAPNPTEEQVGPDGCILSQERTSAGDLITTVLVPPTDPRLTGT